MQRFNSLPSHSEIMLANPPQPPLTKSYSFPIFQFTTPSLKLAQSFCFNKLFIRLSTAFKYSPVVT